MKTETSDLREYLLSKNAKNQAIIDAHDLEMQKKRKEVQERLALVPYQLFNVKEQKEFHILGGRQPLKMELIKKVAKENGISEFTLEENEVVNREKRPLEFKYNHYVLKY